MTTALVKTDNNKYLTGRPTKLTPALQDKICEVVAAGNYLITACNVVGIHPETYRKWLEWGDQQANNGGGIYNDFSVSIKKAESEAETRRVERVEQAGIGGGLVRKRTITQKDGSVIEDEQYAQPQWLADMTHLERRHPERWGRKDRSTLVVEETKQIVITVVEVVKDYGNRKIEEKGEK